jgi:fucose permease
VSMLFFLWGFASGLLGTLDTEIQNLLGYAPARTIALQNAYWAAYFFGPLLVGYWVLKYQGFKATFLSGLAIYATGAMSFWPSSVLRSYAGFFISNFIVALGLSCLEVAANPFIALAGPGELSEARLNFAQAIGAIGKLISPIIAQTGLLSGIDQEGALPRPLVLPRRRLVCRLPRHHLLLRAPVRGRRRRPRGHVPAATLQRRSGQGRQCVRR